MSDLKLDPVTHDLDLSSGGLEIVSGLDAVVQKLRVRYRFFLGEWFLDTREGIPYFEKILVKAPNRSEIISIFRQVAESTPGIAEVNRIDYDLDTRTRELRIDLWAMSDDGEPIAESIPFIIGAAA